MKFCAYHPLAFASGIYSFSFPRFQVQFFSFWHNCLSSLITQAAAFSSWFPSRLPSPMAWYSMKNFALIGFHRPSLSSFRTAVATIVSTGTLHTPFRMLHHALTRFPLSHSPLPATRSYLFVPHQLTLTVTFLTSNDFSLLAL